MHDCIKTTIMVLTQSQRHAIYPGPGNPDYAKGSAYIMHGLADLKITERFCLTVQTDIAVPLTEFGKQIRHRLYEQNQEMLDCLAKDRS